MNEKCYITLSGVIFLIAACLHILRLINDTQIMLGSWMVPYLFSWFGLIVALALCVWAFLLLKKK
jgi:hypothetical protein